MLSSHARQIMQHETSLLAAMPSSLIPPTAELSDNGATGTVAKTLLGMIPGTRVKSSADSSFAVGDDDTVSAQHTNWHAYYRCANGVKIPTLRKKHYMPNALYNIGSEPEDVYLYGQGYWFSSTTGRQVFITEPGKSVDATCKRVSLLMSPNRLGWYHMEEIKDPHVIR